MAAPIAAPNGGRPVVDDDRAALITRIEIEHYKSVRKLALDLGRVNLFIGENGSGKSNILEAIALGAAASRDKLDNEYLVARGVRVTRPGLMLPAFAPERVAGTGGGVTQVAYSQGATGRRVLRISSMQRTDEDGPRWSMADSALFDVSPDFRRIAADPDARTAMMTGFREELAKLGSEMSPEALGVIAARFESDVGLVAALPHGVRGFEIPAFAAYAPEYSALRRFEEEGALRPLGVRGEGLFEHLQALAAQPGAPAIAEINEHLALLDWFERLEVPSRDLAGRALRIRDRFLADGVVFDQKSANEGFLFLLFYLTLLISPHTPRFFAIDNLDTSLNPKLCQALMTSLVTLAKRHRKQVIVTTHNPSVLDGLDLHDDDQRLFVIARDDDGATQARRVPLPRSVSGEPPVRLSTAFLRGYLGGLPKNF